MLGFTQSHSGSLNDAPQGFIQKNPGQHNCKKSTNITGIDKVDLNRESIIGSIVNDVREPILFSCAFDKLPDHKIYGEHKAKLFKKINPFYLILHFVWKMMITNPLTLLQKQYPLPVNW